MWEIIVSAGSLVLVFIALGAGVIKYGKMQQKVCDCDEELDGIKARLRQVEKDVVTKDQIDGKFERVHRKIEEQGKEFMKEVGELKLSVGKIDGTMTALLAAVAEKKLNEH